ncbi:Sphingolipid (R)-alpha-hydroxylase FAH1 (no EC) [hydrothermal vent metagenome]|uniref:Sphingolipid (R)-alpha-hydroxylase FAH1 (No EC) n=1 Tax=hydrothermal vent metagenome TaxID=652676 RepID=A0A3B1BZY5_9ZZZZ
MSWRERREGNTRLYVSNKDESVRMFESDFLEVFSKVHWSVPLYLFIPIIIYFVYRSYDFGIPVVNFLAIYIGGIAFWTITEYSLHRFLFHYHPKSATMKEFFWTFHGVHHDYPQDSKRLVMPPSVSLPLAVLFYYFFYLVFGVINANPFAAGFFTGYLFYDITHYAIHHFNFKGNIWKKLKDHHSIHHYKYEELGFGVSSPFWDYVFGTTYPDRNKNGNNSSNQEKK